MSRSVRAALPLAAVVALLGAVAWLPVHRWALALVGWVQGAGAAGVAVYAAAYVVAALLVLPGSLLTLGAGFAYGWLGGAALVPPVSVLAATLAFLLGRSVARGRVSRWVASDPRFAALDEAVGERGFRIVLLLRLSPLLPFNLLNYALGLTRVRLWDFVGGSLIGMLPGTLAYVYIGSLVTRVSELAEGRPSAGPAGQALYLGGLLATVAVSLWLARVARRALAGRPPATPREATAGST